jgi:hypothetical protein
MGQFPLIHLESDSKIQIFGSAVILATTGSVGYAQRLHHHIDAAVKGSVFKNFTAREATTNISDRLITDLQKSKAPPASSGRAEIRRPDGGSSQGRTVPCRVCHDEFSG